MTKLLPASRTEDGELVLWKTPYNHDVDHEAARTALVCPEPSKTKQEFKTQQDINHILATFTRTGQLPDIPMPLQYADLTTMEDYHTLQTKLAETNGLFYRLPAAIRASYKNDPGAWLEDVTTRVNAGDLEPLREMGMDLTSWDRQRETITAAAEDQRAAARAAAREAQTPPKQGDHPRTPDDGLKNPSKP